MSEPTPKAKKGAPPEPMAEDKLQGLLQGSIGKALRKRFGEHAFGVASENRVLLNRQVIPTGVYPLDVGLGGGVPVGLVTSFWGPKSSAKSALCAKTVAQAQRLCARCYQRRPCACKEPDDLLAAYVDVEGTTDLRWLAHLGVQVERLLYTQPSTGEDAVEIVETLLRSGTCNLVVLDSIAFLQPAKEIDREVNQPTPGAQARLLTEASRRIVAALNAQGNLTGRRPTLLTVSQERSKVGVVWGSPIVQAGGFAVGYLNAVEIRTSGGKVEMVEDKEARKEFPVYATNTVTVVKSKVAAPRTQGEYRLFFADSGLKKRGDVGDETAMVDDAEYAGLLTKVGMRYLLLDKEFPTRSHVETGLMESADYKAQVRDALLAVLLK